MGHLSTLVLSILSAFVVNSVFAQCPVGGCGGGGYTRSYSGGSDYRSDHDSHNRSQFDNGSPYRSPNDSGYHPTQGYHNPSYGYSQGGYSAPIQRNSYNDRQSTWSDQGYTQGGYVPARPSSNGYIQGTQSPNPSGYAQRGQWSSGFSQSDSSAQSNAPYYPESPQNRSSAANRGSYGPSNPSTQNNR